MNVFPLFIPPKKDAGLCQRSNPLLAITMDKISSLRKSATTLIATVVLSTALHAATTNWTGADPDDNLFGNGANWTNGAPAGGDTGVFNSNGVTIVDFNANATVGALDFQPGASPRTVRLNLSGYHLQGDLTPVALGAQTLVFDGGTYSILNRLRIGSGNVNEETIMRLQNNAVVNLKGTLHRFGISGVFHMEVIGGSELINDSEMQVGREAIGTITVSGVGSRVDNSAATAGLTYVGVRNATFGHGQINVENGGWFHGDRELIIGFDDGDGRLIVSGSGLNSESETVYSTVTTVGGGATNGLSLVGTRTTASSGSGYALFQNGGRGIFEQTLALWDGSVLEIDRGLVTVTVGTANFTNRIFAEGSELIYWLYAADYDPRIDIAGNLVIDQADLTIELGDGFSAVLGEQFHLIRNSDRSGTFKGLLEGDTISIGNYSFAISYDMGINGDMIGLTVIPEPGQFALAAVVLGAVLVLRRRLRREG